MMEHLAARTIRKYERQYEAQAENISDSVIGLNLFHIKLGIGKWRKVQVSPLMP